MHLKILPFLSWQLPITSLGLFSFSGRLTVDRVLVTVNYEIHQACQARSADPLAAHSVPPNVDVSEDTAFPTAGPPLQ